LLLFKTVLIKWTTTIWEKYSQVSLNLGLGDVSMNLTESYLTYFP
jgi:hypothetical protein